MLANERIMSSVNLADAGKKQVTGLRFYRDLRSPLSRRASTRIPIKNVLLPPYRDNLDLIRLNLRSPFRAYSDLLVRTSTHLDLSPYRPRKRARRRGAQASENGRARNEMSCEPRANLRGASETQSDEYSPSENDGCINFSWHTRDSVRARVPHVRAHALRVHPARALQTRHAPVAGRS